MANFSVRARAVDMLGRQQIAGIPTALHELFKNAHDAYARRVEVDYFRSQGLLILRDDGDGMSRSDFVKKWLTLGTESKVDANNTALPSIGPRGLRPRRILGEKGIGRLAVAAIGPVVMVMTRRDPSTVEEDELTVALVHWWLFELPGIDLAAIDIPVRTIPGGTLPDGNCLADMVRSVRANIDAVAPADHPARRHQLLTSLDAFANVDPSAIATWLAGAAARDERPDITLQGNGHGTEFLIAPVDSILNSDIDVKGGWGSSPFQRLLLGFGNTIVGEDAEFAAEFRDHRPDGRTFELIGERSFFTHEEFVSLDHHFDGEFDEFGQFVGTIQLYRGEPQPYVLSWPTAGGRPTECGPFRFRLGYLMGLADESRLPREEHSLMYDKLNRLGGLYIYRDGVRVLPYGNSDYDFLNIEQRRTLAAKDWFFSYRRMIGLVEVGHDNNAALVEKAGREGLRENRAYRQFRDILENFFKQLAIDYFRKDADLGEEFRLERARLEEDADRLKRRELLARERKGKFGTALQAALGKYEAGSPAISAGALVQQVKDRLASLAGNVESGAAPALLDIEAEFLKQLQDLEADTTVLRPRGLAFPKSVEAAWKSYERARVNLRDTLFEPVRADTVGLIEAYRTEHGIDVERQRRANETMEREKAASLAEVRKLRREAEEAVEKVNRAVRDAMRDEVAQFQQYVEELMAALGRVDLDRMSDGDAYDRQREMERSLHERLRTGRVLLESMRDQLVGVAEAIGAGDDVEETAAALERRSVELQDRLDLYTDLAQAGSAIGIVGHEFENVADGVRRSVERLKVWADGTPAIKIIYDDINSYFSELDSYLALFAPLSRRRYRRKSQVAGTYVEKYLNEALAGRLDENGVRLEVTDAFRKRSLLGFLPTLLGASLNLVDNAIYWTTAGSPENKAILLDADDGGWLFSNVGPGVPLRMEERIFEFGISTKPGGRGMGLAVSRDALRKIGLDLVLLNPGAQNAPVFRIGPVTTDVEDRAR